MSVIAGPIENQSVQLMVKQEMDGSYAKSEESGVFSASNASDDSLVKVKCVGGWTFYEGEIMDPKVFNPPDDLCVHDTPSFLCNISSISGDQKGSCKCKCLLSLNSPCARC